MLKLADILLILINPSPSNVKILNNATTVFFFISQHRMVLSKVKRYLLDNIEGDKSIIPMLSSDFQGHVK